MSDIKTEPTPDQAKQIKLEQEREAGVKNPDPNVNPRNGRDDSGGKSTANEVRREGRR